MQPPIEWERARELNRARWDALAALHGQDAYYDTEAPVAGRDTLTPEEDEAVRTAVGDVDVWIPAGGSVFYAHSIGEIVSAAAGAGLRVDALTEHLRCSFEHRNGIPQLEQDCWWRLRADGIPLPLPFTLLATAAG